MLFLADILKHKGRGAVSIAATATLQEAARAMDGLGIGSLLVGSSDEPVGLVSERDLVRRLAIDPLAGNAQVAEVMGPVVEVGLDAEVPHGLHVMTERRLRHLVVVEKEEVVGIVSIGDLVKAQRDEQREAIIELDRYLHDRPNVVAEG
jgi:CBS domain-containing protein